MKASDLMVGDWVSYLGFYNKVIYIGQKVSMYDGKGTEFTTDPEHIRPIPLTEEILVKNGFKKERQTIDGDYCKYTLPGFALNWCDTDGFWYQNGDITPNHVHTLQHLLRLCGIEKKLTIN